MITALIISHLLFFPSPIDREPLGRDIALTQWGQAYIGVAHNNKAGAAMYQAGDVRVLIGGEWVDYQVVASGVYLCDVVTPNCNDAVFLAMYEPRAVILATCWPRGGMTRGQFIIKMLPTLDSVHDTNYNGVHETNTQ